MGWEAFCLALVLTFFHFHFSRRWDTVSLSFFDACMHGQDSTFIYETPVRRLNTMAPPSQLFCLAGIYTFSLVCSRSYETALALALAWIAFIRFSTVH
ncbi:hypothetical protein BJX65DRAFT_142210 [Aspergillus insuetus]